MDGHTPLNTFHLIEINRQKGGFFPSFSSSPCTSRQLVGSRDYLLHFWTLPDDESLCVFHFSRNILLVYLHLVDILNILFPSLTWSEILAISLFKVVVDSSHLLLMSLTCYFISKWLDSIFISNFWISFRCSSSHFVSRLVHMWHQFVLYSIHMGYVFISGCFCLLHNVLRLLQE